MAQNQRVNERVDVLIIGSGASGAAVAWSLAETRMRILCLEQGDWVRSTDFPSNGRDWEARRYTDFDISPNRRGRDTDYPVNDDNSVMKIANFNGVGGGTVIYTAHWPRMHPSDFKVKSLDGVADDWPVDYWALAIRAGVALRTRCRVREITTNEHGMAAGAIYYDADGREHFQPAEVVIVACNGVGTPRLLLASASGRFPDGLANSSGLVGKNLMLHPWPIVYGYVEETLDGGRGPITTMWSKQFYETDPSRGFVRGYTLQFGRGTGTATEAISSAAAGRLPWGRDHHRIYRELLNHRV